MNPMFSMKNGEAAIRSTPRYQILPTGMHAMMMPLEHALFAMTMRMMMMGIQHIQFLNQSNSQ